MDKSILNKRLKEINQQMTIYLTTMKKSPNKPGVSDHYFKLKDEKDAILAQLKHGVAEGLMNTIANKVMGAAPEQPKYKVGQRVKYEASPNQPDWKDGGRGVGVITSYKNGHYIINDNPVNHFEIKGMAD